MPPAAYAMLKRCAPSTPATCERTHAAYRRGTAYLVRTQLDDGRGFSAPVRWVSTFTWNRVPSRPHQFISAAAMAWAAIALGYALWQNLKHRLDFYSSACRQRRKSER